MITSESVGIKASCSQVSLQKLLHGLCPIAAILHYELEEDIRTVSIVVLDFLIFAAMRSLVAASGPIIGAAVVV